MYRGECVQERLNQELREVFNKLSASEEKRGTLVAQLEETMKKLQHAEEEKQTLQVLTTSQCMVALHSLLELAAKVFSLARCLHIGCRRGMPLNQNVLEYMLTIHIA